MSKKFLLLLLLVLPFSTRAQTPKPIPKTHIDLPGINVDIDDDDADKDNSKPKKPKKVEIDPRSITAAPFGDRMDLTSTWLLHSGSDPAFAQPAFDDQSWERVDTSNTLILNGFFNLNQVWYRLRVHLPANSHGLALTVANFGGSYRVFANGRELGGHGKMADRGDYLTSGPDTYPIPDDVLGPDLVIAIHAYLGTVDRTSFTFKNGLNAASHVYLGPAAVLARDQARDARPTDVESPSVLTLWALLSLLALALALLLPRSPEYRLLAIYAGGILLNALLTIYAETHFLPRTAWISWPMQITFLAYAVAGLEFCRIIAGSPRRRWLPTLEVSLIVASLSLYLAAHGLLSFVVYSVILRLLKFTVFVSILVYLGLGISRRKRDVYVLLSTAGLYLIYLVLWFTLDHIVYDNPILNGISRGFVRELPPGAMSDFALILGFLAILIVRTLSIVRERASIANEIEAARTMQQLLLSGSSAPTPGFVVDTVYLPAGEVGGDFFLVSPCEVPDQEPSLTVIVGDVSGKGLRAAMRVSMILGVLRREPSREPAAVLHGLNQALLDAGDTGFTTACCIRLSPNGRYSLANAGHIAPYVAGRELLTAPALPLGLASMAGEQYPVLEGHLFPGQRIVLLSDGVPEARTPKGELYGFDRLGPLTLRPAQDIAKTAQLFGQDDDITVLTIACSPRSTNLPPPPPPPPPPV